jgi:hypothetical protein
MSCTDINGFNESSCVKSMGGLKNVWIFPFNAIDEYVYTSDYLHKITGYSSTITPVNYTPNYNSSEYKATEVKGEYKVYNHTLSLTFSKMEAAKREELIKLESMELTIIFQDRNDLCWIMGQDVPVKLTIVDVASGVKGGNSTYKLSFTSREKNHLREIECPSDSCFVSFKGVENRVSTIVVENASTLVWQDFVITADDQILTYTSPSALDPTTWGVPASLTADLLQLSYLINQYGTPVVPNTTLVGSYDGGLDEATITITSPDTSYGAFQVDNVVTNSTISIALNLITTVSPLIANPSTIIKVDDSIGTLYSTPYGSSVSGTGLSGISQDSVIQVSDLYPTGTTFTMSIVGLPCATQTYEYTYEPTLRACEILMDYDFYKGQQVKITIPYVIGHVDCPRYQNISVNINGQIYQLYTNYTTWHDDDATFENDLINLFNQTSILIDTGSIIFTHNASDVDVAFNISPIVADTDNYYFNTYVRGFDQPAINTTQWRQGRILNINTSAPYPSVVSIEDQNTNIISGENLVNISSNSTYTLGSTPSTSNTSIDNVGLLWALDSTLPYSETSLIDISADAVECLAPTLTSGFDMCYTGFDSSANGNFITLSLDTTSGSVNAGPTYTMITGAATTNITLPSSVTPNANFHLLTNALNAIKGIQVIHMQFHAILRTYSIYIQLDPTASIVSFTEDTTSRPFALSPINVVYLNTLLTKVNPYTTLEWTCPTVATSSPTGVNNLTVGHWQEDFQGIDELSVDWDQGADTITLTKLHSVPATAITDYTVTLHEEYPTQVNSFLTMFLPAGSPSLVTGSIASTLITNGSNVNDINYVAYTNYMGWRYIEAIDLTIASDSVTYVDYLRRPILWGTMDGLSYVGTAVSPAPTVSSVVCYDDCCDPTTEPNNTNTQLTYTYTGTPEAWSSIVEFFPDVRCDIVTVEVDIVEQGGSPAVISGSPVTYTSDGCVIGIHTLSSTNNVEFATSPVGFGYDLTITLYDLIGTVITSYTDAITL